MIYIVQFIILKYVDLLSSVMGTVYYSPITALPAVNETDETGELFTSSTAVNETGVI